MFPNKWVILWDSQPIGLDGDSGGYPYKTDRPMGTKFWDTKEEAERYLRVFENSHSYGFYGLYVKIVEVQFRIVGEE